MKNGWHVLVVGQLWAGSTSENHRCALESLGYKTIGFDVSPYTTHRNPIIRSVGHRLNAGPIVARLNRDLQNFVRDPGWSVDFVWVEKGKWLYPETVTTLKERCKRAVVHYTPDAQLVDNQSRQFNESIPLYDVMFTTKPFEVDLYRNLGARNIFLVHQSYDSRRLYPRSLDRSDREAFESGVSFIGHYQPHYARYLKTASQLDARLRVWGPGWRRYSRVHQWSRRVFAGDGVWQEDYAKALNGAAIALCLLSKKIPETTTTRSFEIPGSGAFMLAERSAPHLELFQEGVEAEFFASPEEFIEKINFYLRNPLARKKIAAAGHQRCIRSGYDDLSRMRQMIEVVQKVHD